MLPRLGQSQTATALVTVADMAINGFGPYVRTDRRLEFLLEKMKIRKFSTKKVSPLISRFSVAVAVFSLFFLAFSPSNPLRK